MKSDDEINKNKLYDKADIEKALNKVGLKKHYGMENDKIIVQQSDSIKVSIDYSHGRFQVKSLFPTIGNGPQILMTIVIIVAFYYFGIPFPWVFGIIGGQLFSYVWFKPKIERLKMRVEAAFYENLIK